MCVEHAHVFNGDESLAHLAPLVPNTWQLAAGSAEAQ